MCPDVTAALDRQTTNHQVANAGLIQKRKERKEDSGGSRQRRERRALPPQKKGKKKHVDLVHDELKRDPHEDTDVEVDRCFKRAN